MLQVLQNDQDSWNVSVRIARQLASIDACRLPPRSDVGAAWYAVDTQSFDVWPSSWARLRVLLSWRLHLL